VFFIFWYFEVGFTILAQAGFELTILLPQPSCVKITCTSHHTQLFSVLYFIYYYLFICWYWELNSVRALHLLGRHSTI
jgi:hypothetical protein